jgi:hypothetical protein
MRLVSRRSGWSAGLAVAGAGWSVFLLPPQLVAWDVAAAPRWAQHFAETPAHERIRRLAAGSVVEDDYALFGSLVAPSFLLIGLALWLAVGGAGRWVRLVALLTMAGLPVTLLSYLGQDAAAPWRYFWGTEALLLLAIGLTAVPAGVAAHRRRRLPRWSAALLASTILVLVASTALFGYFPHGSLVGHGLEVALLAAGGRRQSPQLEQEVPERR